MMLTTRGGAGTCDPPETVIDNQDRRRRPPGCGDPAQPCPPAVTKDIVADVGGDNDRELLAAAAGGGGLNSGTGSPVDTFR